MSWNYKLTQQGANLIASLSDKKLIFSSAKCSSQVSTGKLEELTELANVIKNMDILGISSNEGTMCIELELTNIGVATKTDVYQLGLYAKTEDTNEILFAVWQTDTPTTMPKATSMPWSKQYELYLKATSLEDVSIEVNVTDFLRKGHNEDSLAHQDIRNELQSAKEELEGLKNDYEQSKNSLSNGRELVANAITEKGVATDKEDSFSVMADNISLISNSRLYDLFLDPIYETLTTTQNDDMPEKTMYNPQLSTVTQAYKYTFYLKGEPNTTYNLILINKSTPNIPLTQESVTMDNNGHGNTSSMFVNGDRCFLVFDKKIAITHFICTLSSITNFFIFGV